LNKPTAFLVENANFFAKFFDEQSLKIVTSVPVKNGGHLSGLFGDAVHGAEEDVDGATAVGAVVRGPDHQILKHVRREKVG
jgi:hypothetical protein